jgi:PKD domain/RTX calcium-binding nonapeptide repeat (4 copies)
MKYNTLKALQNAVLETLESRQMMSGTPLGSVTLDKGVVTITGDAQAPTNMTVSYAQDGNLLAHAGQTFREFSFSQVKQLVINGGAGADYIYIDPNINLPATISSGQGNDTIHTGGGNDSITAGNGNVLIYGKGGNNTITVGDGNDTLLGGGNNDVIHAGNGNDWIVGGGGSNFIVAGNGDDTIIGGGGNDSMTVGNGNDLLRGSLGNDSLSAGTGNDILEGDSGNDTLVGGGAGTTVNSGPGTNTVEATPPKVTSTTPTAPTTPTTPTKPVAPTAPTTTTKPTTTTTTTPTKPTSGTTTTPTTTPTGGGTTTTTTTVQPPKTNSNAPAPTPVLELLSGTRQTGIVVNANGLNSKLNNGTVLTATFEWNFGDPTGKDNTLAGYSAAHVYDTPGTYTITLTVTNGAGGVATATQQVTIAASTRNQIYIDPTNGSDSNSGNESAPIKTLDQAISMLHDNTELLLKAGQTYTVPATLHIANANVLIGRYGSGANPILSRTVGGGVSTINIYSSSNGVTIQDITFDSPYGVGANDVANKLGVSGIYAGGTNICIRDCEFLNVDDAINENAEPTGVLVEDNTAPSITGIRGYFDWVQGQEQTIVGNVVANSTREHIVRMVDWTNVSIENNNFTNANRQNVDPNDYSKGCIEMHVGSYGYVVDNSVTGGDIRTGPLGLWGEPATDTTSWCKIEDNNLTGTFVLEEAGSEHTLIDNNVFTNSAGSAITIAGENSLDMESSDITITNNTALNTGSSGSFLTVSGPATGITMTNNLWIAPKVTLGSGGSIAVNDANSGLSDFTEIANNVWPASNGGSVSDVGSAYLTAEQWNSLPQVKTDVFENVTLGNTYQISLGSLIAGANVPMAA